MKIKQYNLETNKIEDVDIDTEKLDIEISTFDIDNTIAFFKEMEKEVNTIEYYMCKYGKRLNGNFSLEMLSNEDRMIFLANHPKQFIIRIYKDDLLNIVCSENNIHLSLYKLIEGMAIPPEDITKKNNKLYLNDLCVEQISMIKDNIINFKGEDI